jgi:hypothetical protein
MKCTIMFFLAFCIVNWWEVGLTSEIYQFDDVTELFDLSIGLDNSIKKINTSQSSDVSNNKELIIPDFMNSPVKGISFFYLDGRVNENLPALIQELPYEDSAMAERLEKTIDEMRESGFNWVRILISKVHYSDFDDIYPSISIKEAEKINTFIDYFRSGDNQFKIELVLDAGFIDGTRLRDIENDAIFFQSILSQIDTTGIELVMLGGDLMPCNYTSLMLVDETLCDEDGPGNNWNDAEWIRFQLSYFTNHNLDKLRKLQYSFDTITYPTVKTFMTYLEWVKNNVIAFMPVVSVSGYYAQSGATESDYLAHFNALVNAYEASGIDKPFLLDEYGFALEEIVSEKERFIYLKGFLQATRCRNGVDTSLFYPSMAWVAASDQLGKITVPNGTKFYGLVDQYNSDSSPVVSQSWNLIKWFNTTDDVCSKTIPNYQQKTFTTPVGANSLLLN